MYQMSPTATATKTKIGIYHSHSHTVRRTNVIGLLILYALASASIVNAAVIIKRDIDNHFLASGGTLPGNGTTETPATTAATIRRAEPSADNDLYDKHNSNGTIDIQRSESNENNNNDNAIVLHDQKTINDFVDEPHQIIGHNDEAPEHYDEPDESLAHNGDSKKSSVARNFTFAENSVEPQNHNRSSIQAPAASIVSNVTHNESVTTIYATLATTSTVSPSIVTQILPEKQIKTDQDRRFAEYKLQRNKTGDTDISINDIKDDLPKSKNISMSLASPDIHEQAEPHAIQSTIITDAPNEKRSKSLVDPSANSSIPNDDLNAHKVVGEINGNNVTLGRTNDTNDVLKTMADLVDDLERTNKSTALDLIGTTSAKGLLNESLLHNSSSRIDDSVHQDISIVQITTTVTPKTVPHRIASITRKEIESRRIDDAAVFNAASGNNRTRERIVQAPNVISPPDNVRSVSSKQTAPVLISSLDNTVTTVSAITETTESPSTTTTTEVATTESDELTTTEFQEFTTILDDLTTTITPETAQNNDNVPLAEHSIPKRTTITVDVTTTQIPDFETTPIFSTTVANRIPDVDEPISTNTPTVAPAPSTKGPPVETSVDTLHSQESTLNPISITPTKPMNVVETSTDHSVSPALSTAATISTNSLAEDKTTGHHSTPTTSTQSTSTTTQSSAASSAAINNKMKLEISTTAIDLNRQEDKYSTEDDQPENRPPPSSTVGTIYEDPLEETTYGMDEDGAPANSSDSPTSGNRVGEGLDINAIIAISVSVVGIIALILLVGFLFLMRKRQKQLTYGQRCRPVGLDAYSLDNISVYNSVRRKGGVRSSKRAYGNVGFDDPGLKNNLLNMAGLANFVQKKTAIYDEFKDVPLVTARIDEVPAGCEDKNRYANVVPLPESRVVLKRIGDEEKTEYINANFVRGPKDTTHYYIACQAPMENTTIDFWRMIWEQNSRVIIMATDLTENGIEKCADYLPPSFVIDNHIHFGDYQVILKNREVKEKYAVSSIHLKNAVTKTWREITHLWYQWPDKGIPTDEASLIAMLLEARSYLKMNLPEQGAGDVYESSDADLGNGIMDKNKSLQRVQGPLTIHCSPGTGRTGTIVACDIAIRALEQQTRSVDIPQIVYLVRRGRASAVQTREQYEFIYKVAHMYATKLHGPINEN